MSVKTSLRPPDSLLPASVCSGVGSAAGSSGARVQIPSRQARPPGHLMPAQGSSSHWLSLQTRPDLQRGVADCKQRSAMHCPSTHCSPSLQVTPAQGSVSQKPLTQRLPSAQTGQERTHWRSEGRQKKPSLQLWVTHPLEVHLPRTHNSPSLQPPS